MGSGAYYFNKYVGGEMICVDPSGRQERRFLQHFGWSDLPRSDAEFHAVSRTDWSAAANLGGPNSAERRSTTIHISGDRR